jgi:hypothetical protein
MPGTQAAFNKKKKPNHESSIARTLPALKLLLDSVHRIQHITPANILMWRTTVRSVCGLENFIKAIV